MRFVTFDITLKMDIFNANTQITTFLSDFEYLTQGLELSYKTLSQTFYFKVLDGEIEIKFITDQTGHIQVSGKLYSNYHRENFLTFQFSSDQTFIPDMIKECKQDVAALNLANI